ncbi:MAG: hypothetical protein QW751_00045 [Candidatus Aenigmatarchaeota archaeon]|nr:hypothetical protein [Candidatus Aenigmarchaeota archaeon]
MTFRVTRNSDGSITAESDCPGNEVDHVFAHNHCEILAHYMKELGLKNIEGRDYNDIVNRIVNEEVKRYGGDPGAVRGYISTELVW